MGYFIMKKDGGVEERSGKKSDGSNEEELEEYKRKIVQEQL